MRRARLTATPGPRGARRRRVPTRPLLLFIGTLGLVHAVAGERGLLQRAEAREAERALRAEIATLQKENLHLRAQADRLRQDAAAIEALARRDLGLIRPGEVLVIVRSGPNPRPSPPPPASTPAPSPERPREE